MTTEQEAAIREQAIRERLGRMEAQNKVWATVRTQNWIEAVSTLLAALDAARAERVALLSRLEALERQYRMRAATAEQDGEELVRMVADDVADDLAALRAEMG